MIYLFDESKTLTGTVRDEHVRSLLYDREKNGMYDISAEIPVIAYHHGNRYNLHTATKNAVFLGHYDLEGRFQLHKIAGYDVNSDTIAILGVHIFFDEAKAGAIIKDRRYIDREISAGARDAFAEIGWHLADFDVSPKRTYNFYNVSPLEARATLIETFGFEFDYWIDFDGKKISGKYFSVKKQIGQDSGKRYTYDKHTNTGHHVLELTAETDYSEVYTAVIGRGKGEEIEDTGGYGRRIEYTDIEWTKPNRPLNKPRGSRVLIDPEATQAFGYVQEDGTVTPRTAVVEFSDIEEQSELLEASYDWLVEHRHPKLVFDVNVADGDGLELGDTVYIKYNEIGLNMAVRVGKVIDDLKSGERQVQLGDVAYFKPGRVNRDIKRSIRQERRDANSRIYQLKLEFNERFDNEVQQILDDYEQALIDAHAEIQAAEQRMEALITKTRNDWTDTFEAEVAEIYRKADEDYNRIETEITGVIDSTRNDIETNFNESVQNTREYAEQQAQERADAVRTDLETVTSGHQEMLQDLKTNVMNIDDFLGSARDITLDQRLLDMTSEFNEQLSNASRSASNMLRGSRFDEPDMINQNFMGVSLHTSEHENFIRLNTIQSNIPLVIMNGELHLHAGVKYHLHIEYRTDTVTELDGFVFYHNDGTTERLENRGLTITGLTTSGAWEHASLTLTPNAEMSGRLAIGTRRNYGTSPDGIIDVRLPYLTATAHDQWLPHPLDANQNIEEISRRITALEDGYSDFIVRSVWDAEMNSLNQTIRDYQTTVDGVEDTIIQLQDSEVITRGREVIDTVDGFSRKVWLGDIDRPNLIPHADVLKVDNRNQWIGRGSRFNGSYRGLAIVQADSLGNYIGMESPKIYDYVESGETYTLSWEGQHLSGYPLSDNFDYVYLVGMSGNNIQLYNIQRTAVSGYGNRYRYTATFEMPNTITKNTRILFGVSRDGESGGLAYVRFGKPKLELGSIASPFETSYSMLEQRADSIALQVDDQESRISNFTVDLDGIMGRVGDIEGDYIKQSSLEITPEYAQIGSMRIDGETVGSMLRVSPDGIDAIASAMRLSGDLYVDGDITALAVDAMEGEFARLWADEFSAITIDVDDIQGFTARFEWLYTLNANIKKLVSQKVFADNITARIGNFVDVNAGNIVTSGLSANVILSSHINSSNALINKIFSNSARIDTLISKTHFVNKIKATSIDAVYADLRSVNSEIMTSNIIKANWVEGGKALFDKVFISNAMVERLTSKSAFIRDIQAIEITANQLNLTTLTNRINQIEGGLRITRPDGVDWVRDGQARGHVPVQIFDSYADSEVGFTGLNFTTGSSHWKTFKYFYTPHEGTRLRVVWAVGLYDGPSNVEYMDVRVRNFSGYAPINMNSGSSVRRATLRAGKTTYITQDVPMPPPNYSLMAAYLDFRRAPDGQSTRNRVYARVLHIGQYE